MARSLRILLLEARPLDAEIAERQLRRAGMECTFTRVDSESGFRTELLAGNYDAILADYHVPDFDGMSALLLASKIAADIPFLFVSGSVGEERVLEALREGAAGFILKDRPTHLAAALTAALARKRDQQVRMLMLDSLVRSEQRYHFVAQATRDVIWDWDIDGDVLWVSDALRSEWGYELDGPEVSSARWVSGIHPEDRGRVTDSLRQAILSSQERWAEEYRFERADGTYSFVLDRRVIIRRPDGRAMRIAGAMEDITKRKLCEIRASEAERLMGMAHFSMDLESGKREWSTGLCRIFEFEAAHRITDEMFLSRIHPGDRELVARAIRPPGPDSFDFRIVSDSGGIRVLHARVQYEHNQTGAITRLFCIAQDVTDRVEAERQMGDLSKINDSILDYAAEGILGLDAGGKVMFANPAAAAFTGWSDEELKSAATFHDLVHHSYPDGTPYPEEHCQVHQSLVEGKSCYGEETLWRKSGEAFPIHFSSSPMFTDGRVSGAVVIFEDVTEHAKLQRQLEQANRVSSLGRVAATIAHEFNNVLMGIQPFAEVIRRWSDEENILNAANRIITSVARGKRVTEQILRFTQPSAPVLQPILQQDWIEQKETEGVSQGREKQRQNRSGPPTGMTASKFRTPIAGITRLVSA